MATGKLKEHFEENRKHLRRFGESLAKLAEQYRADLEKWSFDSWLRQVSRYFDGRKSGETPADWLQLKQQEAKLETLRAEHKKLGEAADLAGKEWRESIRYGRTADITQADRDKTATLKQRSDEAENKAEQFERQEIEPHGEKLRDDREFAKWLVAHIKSDKPDRTKLHAEAKQSADNALTGFVDKASGKVFGFLIGQSYTIEKVTGGWIDGTIEGDIVIGFANGRSFRLNIFLRLMPSQSGRFYYGQYPLYFRDVVKKKGAKPLGTVAEDELYGLFDIGRWSPPPQPKPKPKRVTTGSVIRTKSGSVSLVLRIDKKKNVVKVWTANGKTREKIGQNYKYERLSWTLADGTESTIDPAEIVEILATELHTPYRSVSWKLHERGRAIQLHPYMPENFHNLNHNEGAVEIRKLALAEYGWLFAGKPDKKKIKAKIATLEAIREKEGKNRYSLDHEEHGREISFLKDELDPDR